MISGGGDLPPSWLVNSGSAATYGRSITGSRELEPQDQLVLEICGGHIPSAAVGALARPPFLASVE